MRPVGPFRVQCGRETTPSLPGIGNKLEQEGTRFRGKNG
jgi:hypothetical protein